MKSTLAFTALALAAAGTASAQSGPEMGRVISSTPVVQQVAVPRQVCGTQQVITQAPPSGAGAVIGAIAGGVVGNAIGHGGGRAAATALGLVGGAALGNTVEARGNPAYAQDVQNCYTQTDYQPQTVGYNVTYEYAGRRYTTQMANDPGRFVPVQVGAVGDQAPAPTYTPQASYAPQPAYVQQGVVVPTYTQAPPPVVYAPSYYAPGYVAPAPVGVSIGLGYYGGHRGWR